MKLQGKKILIGITAGIAAYKICELVRLFKKQEAEVKIIMTENAKNFVSPLTLSALSQNKVYCEQFDYSDYDIEHISLASWADMFVIAPLTANTLSKIANGICDNLLTSVLCAFNKPVLVAPAMNVNMYNNKVTQENLEKLKSLNYYILEPEEGFLACGVNAKGRMVSIEEIVNKTAEIFEANKKHKKIIITAGGTKENIDPVRYVGNYSSGKMGIALADEAYNSGYDVLLISTVETKKPYEVLKVTSADEMYAAVKKEFEMADILIMAAAVADFKPIQISEQKIKKENKDTFVVKMVKNPDILKEIGKIKTDKQTLIGFCAESENLINNATKKLNEKNADFIIANNIARDDIGFGSDYNEITILSKNGINKTVSRKPKTEIAKEILKTCLD